MVRKLVIYNNQRNAPKPNRPLVPGTCGVVVNKDKKVLLHKRVDNDFWSLPGGQMKLGESISQCLIRELREETGLRVKIIKLVGVYTSPKVIFEFPNGDTYQSFVIAFLCKSKNEKVVLNKESTFYEWFTLGDVKNLKTLPFVKETIFDAFSKRVPFFD